MGLRHCFPLQYFFLHQFDEFIFAIHVALNILRFQVQQCIQGIEFEDIDSLQPAVQLS